MNEVSTRALMLAIQALVREKELAERRVEGSSPAQDEEEHLADQVMEIEKAIGELGLVYERQQRADPLYPSFAALLASGKDFLG